MTAVASPRLRSFSAVDLDSGAPSLIAAVDEQAAIPAIQRLRAAGIEQLAIRVGDHLIDVGCGTGEVARILAGQVGPLGSVVGIDASDKMVAEARRRASVSTLPVEFRIGDITNLELDEASCDGVLCERVFQHLASPHEAIGELVRITRRGGRIVVIDTDWGLHAIHGADPTLTAAIVDHWAQNAANGLAGRQLPALFADAGIPDATVVADTLTSTDPRRTAMPPLTLMALAAVSDDIISQVAASKWLDQLAEAARRGRFFWAVTMFAVAGARP